MRPTTPVLEQTLFDYGKYVADCLPKFVQKVQVVHGCELEVMISPEGILPVLTFLKDHTNAEFTNIVDICGVDVPTRQNRFEVGWVGLYLRIIMAP